MKSYYRRAPLKTHFCFKSACNGASSEKSMYMICNHFSRYPSLRAFVQKWVFRGAPYKIVLVLV